MALSCTQISWLCDHVHNRGIPLNIMCVLSVNVLWAFLGGERAGDHGLLAFSMVDWSGCCLDSWWEWATSVVISTSVGWDRMLIRD